MLLQSPGAIKSDKETGKRKDSERNSIRQSLCSVLRFYSITISPSLNMHAHTYKHTQTSTNTNNFRAHTPQPSALGLDPVRTIVELLPLLLLDGNCLWVPYHSLSPVCAPVRVRGEFACSFAGVCMCQPVLPSSPSHHITQ